MKEDHYDLMDKSVQPKSKFAASETGALREALGVPYLRQVPLEALAAGATALEYGAEKYDNRNWEKGLPWQQMIDSMRRHIDAFERREEYDDGPDGSGLPHICMIVAGAMMLSTSVMRNIGKDDRLPAPRDNALTPKECSKWMSSALETARNWREENATRNKG